MLRINIGNKVHKWFGWCCIGVACLLSALFVPAEARTGDNYTADPSTSTLAYLRLPLSARAAALENAVTALGYDPAFAMINPALSALAERVTITTSFEWLTLDRQYFFGGLLYPVPRIIASVGVGFVQYRVDKIERRDENGILLGEFKNQENTFALWYGSAFTKKMYWGLAAKYHYNQLDHVKAGGLSFDVGFFSTPINKWNFALTANMLGWGLKWDTDKRDPFIPSIRTGLAHKPFKDYINISSDVEWTPRNYPQGHLGLEYRVIPQICLRGGIQGPNPIKGSGGFGINYKNFIIDYAFIYHHSTLGHSHFLSIGFEFDSLP